MRGYICIRSEAIDDSLVYSKYSHEQACKIYGYDYETFKKVYNNDLSVTLKDIIEFCECFEISLLDLLFIID